MALKSIKSIFSTNIQNGNRYFKNGQLEEAWDCFMREKHTLYAQLTLFQLAENPWLNKGARDIDPILLKLLENPKFTENIEIPGDPRAISHVLLVSNLKIKDLQSLECKKLLRIYLSIEPSVPIVDYELALGKKAMVLLKGLDGQAINQLDEETAWLMLALYSRWSLRVSFTSENYPEIKKLRDNLNNFLDAVIRPLLQKTTSTVAQNFASIQEKIKMRREDVLNDDDISLLRLLAYCEEKYAIAYCDLVLLGRGQGPNLQLEITEIARRFPIVAMKIREALALDGEAKCVIKPSFDLSLLALKEDDNLVKIVKQFTPSFSPELIDIVTHPTVLIKLLSHKDFLSFFARTYLSVSSIVNPIDVQCLLLQHPDLAEKVGLRSEKKIINSIADKILDENNPRRPTLENAQFFIGYCQSLLQGQGQALTEKISRSIATLQKVYPQLGDVPAASFTAAPPSFTS